MFLIVGLGNPGKQYSKTYHNVGYLCVDKLASKLGGKFTKKKCASSICECDYNGEKIIIAKPLSYMNNSGQNVAMLLKQYKVSPDNLIVMLDDIDLDKGVFRYREKGSAGTHNGLRNIVACLHTVDFKRVRVGIGKPECQLIDYVLAQIDKKSLEVIDSAITCAVDKVLELIDEGTKSN